MFDLKLCYTKCLDISCLVFMIELAIGPLKILGPCMMLLLGTKYWPGKKQLRHGSHLKNAKNNKLASNQMRLNY